MKNCPCGRGRVYKDCCGIVHRSISFATTAEDLMRSRYTAFTKAKGDYLLESHHISTRPVDEMNEIISWAKSVKWLRLEILNATNGGVDDSEGTVEFKAYFKSKGKVDCIHENSKFVKESGVWYYLEKIEQ